MGSKEKYIRVGTQLFKTVRRPMISGDFIEEKVAWSYETLRQDYGKNNLPDIEKYDGLCIIPDHVNYKQVHGTYLNQYEPTPCQPAPGEFPHTVPKLWNGRGMIRFCVVRKICSMWSRMPDCGPT